MNTKVRLVRCPRCHKVLRELPEVPVYKCGGCGAVLQAKIQKNDVKEVCSCSNEVNPVQSNEPECVSDQEETTSLNQLATLHSIGESTLDKTNGRDENEYKDCNRGHSGKENNSNLVHSSSEPTCHENELSSPNSQARSEADGDEYALDRFNGKEEDKFGHFSMEHSDGEDYLNLDVLPGSTELTSKGKEQSSPKSQGHWGTDDDDSQLDQYNGSDQNEFGDCIDDPPGNISYSNEVTSKGKEQSSPESQAHGGTNDDDSPLDQCNGSDQNEFGDCIDDPPEKISFSNEVSSSTGLHLHKNKPSSAGAGTNIEMDNGQSSLEEISGGIENCSREWLGNTQISNEVISSIELSCHEIEETSPLARADAKVDENLESNHPLTTLSAESFSAPRPRDPSVSGQRLSAERILPDKLTSSQNEQLEQSQENTPQDFKHLSFVGGLDNIPLIDPNSDLSVTLRDKYKSPTTRNYYAYDGSVSSYDETDDQYPGRHFRLSKRNLNDAGFIHSKGLPRREKSMMNNTITSQSKMQHRAMNSSSISPGKNHRGLSGSKWNGNELAEPRRHGHPNRYQMKLESDESLPRVPFYLRGAHERHGHNEFHCHSNFRSCNEPKNPETDKMELLQMVHELEDQLNKLHIPKGKENGRFLAGVARKEKQVPEYCNHLAPQRELYPDLNPRYLGRYGQEKIWSHHCKISRMAFSGEASYSRHQADCSCLHCHPKDWHWTAQLPPHVVCCNSGHCMIHPSLKYHCPYHSSPSSPQHYTRSECSSWSRDTKSDGHHQKNHDVGKLYVREKHQLMKRHSRPVAGGAPIVACYHCSELLQLPADFLLFERKCHHLRCSACSQILKFSLQNKTHLVPYVTGATAPPPSEADDYSDAVNKRNLSVASQTDGFVHAEPVSCSEDYGQSFCRSSSTDGDPSSLTPFHPMVRTLVDRKLSSFSSLRPSEDRQKSILSPSSKLSKQEKPSSEIEELRPGSPLHRLMGYSSPSKVIKK